MSMNKSIAVWTIIILTILITIIFIGKKLKMFNQPSLSSSELHLSLKSQKINEEMSFPENFFDYDLVARNNDSISQINFSNRENTILGFIELSPYSSYAELTFFETNEVDPSDFWKIQGNLAQQHTTYTVTQNADIKTISLNFNQPRSLFSNLQYSNESIDLTGNLTLNAPAHWAIFQTQRFPKREISGEFRFNDKVYQLKNINSPSRINESFESIKNNTKTDYIFEFEHQRETLELTYEQRSPQDGQKFYITHQGELYELNYKAHHKDVWQETKDEINININPVTVKGKHSATEAKLSIHLRIPKHRSNLTANGLATLLLGGNTRLLAETRNNERTYQLAFSIANDELLILFISQIGDSIYNVYYYDDDGIQYCGDDHQSCFGLNISTDQKNIQFNQVKVGKYTLNGDIFIAGVL